MNKKTTEESTVTSEEPEPQKESALMRKLKEKSTSEKVVLSKNYSR